MEAIAAGDAALNRGLRQLSAGLDVFDLALDRPVGDAALAPAMSERECAGTMAFGMEALAKQPDLLMLLGAGPGAETAAARLAQALTGAAGEDAAVARALADADAEGDALQLLRQLGGRETAALAGAILAARIQAVPVLLDGAPALAAAAVLQAADPEAIAHCRIARAPHSAVGRSLAARLGRGAQLGLQLNLEDGTAALAALSIVKLAVAIASEPGV
jgi:nicotinate-nucleotide--dimethylbenzimidazole phosphoribosyltransferase